MRIQKPLIPIVMAAVALIGCGSTRSTPAQPTPTPGVTVPANLPPGVTAAMVTDGEQIYRTGTCPICHGVGGRNGPYGPDLTDSVFLQNSGAYDEIITTITNGVPASAFKSPSSQAEFFMQPKGTMTLTDAQLRALAAYVWVLGHPNG